MREDTQRKGDEPRQASPKGDLARKLDVVGWGILFVWIGAAWIASLGLGVLLVGAAVVVLGMQFVRKAVDLPLQGFSLFVGLCLAVAGVWRLAGLEADIVPVLFILVGAALLISALARSRRYA